MEQPKHILQFIHAFLHFLLSMMTVRGSKKIDYFGISSQTLETQDSSQQAKLHEHQ